MPAAKKAAPAKAAKAPAKKAAAAPAPAKAVKTVLNKTALVAHVAGVAGVEPKVAKAVLAALDETILSSVSKKGAGEFVMPGLLKIGVQKVPATSMPLGRDWV